MNKKQFALAQIAPYFKDPSTCGSDPKTNVCVNITDDGKMCVAGKNYLPEVRERFKAETVWSVWKETGEDQSKMFIPEVVDVLSINEWRDLQGLHDSISTGKRDLSYYVGKLGLFTLEELEAYSKTI